MPFYPPQILLAFVQSTEYLATQKHHELYNVIVDAALSPSLIQPFHFQFQSFDPLLGLLIVTLRPSFDHARINKLVWFDILIPHLL